MHNKEYKFNKVCNIYSEKIRMKMDDIGEFQIINFHAIENKANLRDLIAATGLVTLLILDSNRRFFSPCDLKIWWMTPKTIGHLFYANTSFLHHFLAIGEFKLELQSGNT